jgi:hypothetical protein
MKKTKSGLTPVDKCTKKTHTSLRSDGVSIADRLAPKQVTGLRRNTHPLWPFPQISPDRPQEKVR